MRAIIGIQGRVTITRHDFGRVLSRRELAAALEAGVATVVHDDHNHITDDGLKVICAMLAGGYGSGGEPTIGGQAYTENNAHDPSGAAGAFAASMKIAGALVPPSVADPTDVDTDLESTPDSNPLSYLIHYERSVFDGTLIVSYPAIGVVTFSGVMPQVPTPSDPYINGPSDEGMTYFEEGLFTADGAMIARTTFAQGKDATAGLQFDHSFTVTRS